MVHGEQDAGCSMLVAGEVHYKKQVAGDKEQVLSSRGAKRRGDLIGYELLNEIAAPCGLAMTT